MSKWSGPMTSQEVRDGLAELVGCGDAEVVGVKNGETRYRMTAQGKRRAEEMIRNDTEAREFMARLVANKALEDARKPVARQKKPRGKRK